MSKYWHILATIGLAAVSVITPSLQGLLASHTIIATVLASGWAILGNILKSPVASQAS
jgi:hypothetical protein